MPWTQFGPASEPAPPAGRDDTAMIEAAAIAAYKATKLMPWGSSRRSDKDIFIAAVVRAAAAVIVPATAEQIAVEFENWSETATWLTSDTCRAVANMIRSLDFGAGLSAGAPTGEDGDRGLVAALDAGLITGEEAAEARTALTGEDGDE